MRLMRINAAEAVATCLKVLVLAAYSAWAFKLGVIDTDTPPLFAVTMVLLSIYGLWAIIRKTSEHLVRIVEGNSASNAVP